MNEVKKVGAEGATETVEIVDAAPRSRKRVALLVAVPRLRMTVRRLRSAVLVVGIGITLLNTVGRSFVTFVQQNPAYALAGSAVGLLVYLYVFNQILLFGAAWAATSRHGRVVDYSANRETRAEAVSSQP